MKKSGQVIKKRVIYRVNLGWLYKWQSRFKLFYATSLFFFSSSSRKNEAAGFTRGTFTFYERKRLKKKFIIKVV